MSEGLRVAATRLDSSMFAGRMWRGFCREREQVREYREERRSVGPGVIVLQVVDLLPNVRVPAPVSF